MTSARGLSPTFASARSRRLPLRALRQVVTVPSPTLAVATSGGESAAGSSCPVATAIGREPVGYASGWLFASNWGANKPAPGKLRWIDTPFVRVLAMARSSANLRSKSATPIADDGPGTWKYLAKTSSGPAAPSRNCQYAGVSALGTTTLGPALGTGRVIATALGPGAVSAGGVVLNENAAAGAAPNSATAIAAVDAATGRSILPNLTEDRKTGTPSLRGVAHGRLHRGRGSSEVAGRRSGPRWRRIATHGGRRPAAHRADYRAFRARRRALAGCGGERVTFGAVPGQRLERPRRPRPDRAGVERRHGVQGLRARRAADAVRARRVHVRPARRARYRGLPARPGDQPNPSVLPRARRRHRPLLHALRQRRRGRRDGEHGHGAVAVAALLHGGDRGCGRGRRRRRRGRGSGDRRRCGDALSAHATGGRHPASRAVPERRAGVVRGRIRALRTPVVWPQSTALSRSETTAGVRLSTRGIGEVVEEVVDRGPTRSSSEPGAGASARRRSRRSLRRPPGRARRRLGRRRSCRGRRRRGRAR